MIEQLLSLDPDPKLFPVTAEMQERITLALTDYPTPEAAGDSGIAATLALAIVELEKAVVQLNNQLLDAQAERDYARAAVISLERRLLEAGYEFAPPD